MYGQRGGGLGPMKAQLTAVENECRSFAQGVESLDRDVTGLAAEVDRLAAGTVTGMDEETARFVGAASVALRESVAALNAAGEAARRLSGTL